MNERVTVLLAGSEQETKGRLLEVLGEEDLIQLVGIVADPAEAVQCVMSNQPDVVVVCESPRYVWQDLCSYIGIASPRSKIITVLEEVEPNTIRIAMLLGVRQVITCSECASSLLTTISQLQSITAIESSDEYLKVTDPLKAARLIALSGAKGGVGKTTLAVNLGVALAQMEAGSVAIWDAYRQFGDVANLLGMAHTRQLAELADARDDVDDDFLLNFAIHHESGADVLLTSEKPIPVETLSAVLVERVIGALRKRYRFIVADTPPILDPLSSAIFSHCWRLLVVTTLKDVTGISDVMKLIDVLEPSYVRGNVTSIVPNRVLRGDSVREKEVESLTGKAILAQIPEDVQVAQANNMGRPICLTNPRSTAARAIQHLADIIVESASSFA